MSLSGGPFSGSGNAGGPFGAPAQSPFGGSPAHNPFGGQATQNPFGAGFGPVGGYHGGGGTGGPPRWTPPPPKKSPLPWLLIGLGVLAVGALVVVLVLLNGDGSAATRTDAPVRTPSPTGPVTTAPASASPSPTPAASPSPSASPTASPTPTSPASPTPASPASPTPAPTASPTPAPATPTPSAPASPTAPAPPPVGPPVNPPRQAEVPAGYEVLTDNAMYELSPANASCGRPEQFSGTEADRAIVERYVECAREVNEPLLESLGAPAAPRVVVYSGTVETPCGTGGQNRGWAALYCSGNGVIYYDVGLAANGATEQERQYNVHLAFHEYGHYLQHRVGMFDPQYFQQTWETDRNQVERRRELQVDCLGGITMARAGQWSAGTDTTWREWFTLFQDSPTHGSGQNRIDWIRRGTQAGTYGACNTWRADAGSVS